MGNNPDYRLAAKELGKLLAIQEITLVYGGGNVGLMGQIAETVMNNQGEVIGVIPKSLVDYEVAHHGISKQFVVQSMHERKTLMAHLSDGFIALPGGFGTFEELFEIITWNQLGFIQKPVGILNIDDFFKPCIEQIEKAIEEGFIKKDFAERLIIEDDADVLIEKIRCFEPSKTTKKWN